jgi:cytochrome c oxidase subunit 1
VTTPADVTSPPAWQRGLVASWLVSTNHRRLGIMYVALAGVFLVAAGILAILIRTQLIRPELSFVTGNAFDGMVTFHGTAMVFFVVTPVVVGLATALVPLQIGARALAFPGAGSVAFWLFAFGGLTFGLSALAKGGSARAGWTAYPPLSLLQPQNGQDFMLIALVLVALSLFVTAVNLAVTISRHRAPGMTPESAPLFTRSVYLYSGLLLVFVPLWAAGLALLLLAREWPGTFDFLVTGPADDPALRKGTFWLYGQPIAYFALVPILGIVAEILAVFSRGAFAKAKVFVPALAAVGGLLVLVWLHHAYSVGLDRKPATFLLVLAALVLAPAAVALWALAEPVRRTLGKPLEVPGLFALGAVALFVLGAVSGLFLAIWGNDRALSGTAFVVGHAHLILWGPALFALLGGLVYWWPKIFGRLLEQRFTAPAFWLLYLGFSVTFVMHFLAGDAGMPRSTDTYPDGGSLPAYQLIASLASYVAGVGVLLFLAALARSLNGRRAGNDPWRADTLEWYTTSPPPEHSFDSLPEVTSPRPLADVRQRLEEQGVL